jgi:uncharacterized protein (DUF849 family)
MNRPVIITCAVTGSGDTTGLSPHVPITPQQIAEEVLAARAAGAAIAHIHVRNPLDGKPSLELAPYREVVERIRDAKSDIIINLTTGIGARFTPSDENPNYNAQSSLYTAQERVQHVVALKPEICSLDIATMNFGQHAFVNVISHIEQMARAAREAGAKPELEVFDLGHVMLAKHLYKQGLFADPPMFQLCLGVPWGAPATAEGMMAMQRELPAGARWSAFGLSAAEFPMVAQAIIMGGHVRVGLEDNLYLAKGELAPGNACLVERAVRIIGDLGAQVADPATARQILGLG